MSEPPIENERQTGDWKVSLAISVVILAVAGGLAALTFFTEPTAQRAGATKKTAMLVDVVEAEEGTFRPRIVAQGTVEPARDIVLRPQIEGRITSIASDFVPGSYVEEGERLLQLEREDYEHVLAQRESELEQARADLAVEKGRHQASRAEYDRFGEQLPPKNKALVLREPQLEAVKERVEAARAAVQQAKLNLRRTTVEAPFDAHIVRRDVNVGSQVSSNDSLARLVGTGAYWVGIELPLSKIRWVSIAGEGEEPSTVRVRNEKAWSDGVYRTGHLYKRVGVLDDKTRMARVLAKIPDPFAREKQNEGKPSLVIGEFVEVDIQGDPIEEVVRIDRDHVRQDDTVWVMKEGELRVQEVEVVLRDREYVYISSGLEGGARIVTTDLSTVTDGAPLRLKEAHSEEGTSAEGTGE